MYSTQELAMLAGFVVLVIVVAVAVSRFAERSEETLRERREQLDGGIPRVTPPRPVRPAPQRIRRKR